MKITIMGREALDRLSTSALEEIRNLAFDEVTEIRASLAGATPTDEQVNDVDSLAAYIGELDAVLDAREAADAKFNVEVKPRVKAPKVDAVEAAASFGDEGVKDVVETVVPAVANGQVAQVVEASVKVAGVGTPTAAEIAQYQPKPDVKEGEAPKTFSIVASAPLNLGGNKRVEHGAEMDWLQLAEAFQAASDGNVARARTAGKNGVRQHTTIASIRREATEDRVILNTDSPETAYRKLQDMSNRYGADVSAGRESVEAANGFCTPSTPIYDTCSPITATGLINAPRMVVPRGGIIHNQGLDFADFFGGDFVLPIPGYNILTEAEVIADTAKTCFEIPCPPFVDDRLNIAALCLTGSILQNRTYPEFVSTFVSGAIDAMAHLVNREIINAIVAGSTAGPNLPTVDPWLTDGTVLSQLLSAVEMSIVDLRYAYRTDPNQPFTVVLPIWIKAQLRADYIRQNARVDDFLADSKIDALFRERGALVQYVYDWQDAFNPVTPAVPAANQAGAAAAIQSLPFNVTWLVYLPGTWVIGELDIIRLDMVYDSTLLAQNQVTQLFMEDGFKPMRMCPFSRYYTVNICPSGSTGVQRAVACADVTPA